MDKKLKFSGSRLSKLFLALITVLITIGAIALGTRLTSDSDKYSLIDNIRSLQTLKNPVGYKLREKAWKSSFSERGLGIPPGGPREGLRGEGITPVNCAVSDCNFKKNIPGLIEVDANGFQRQCFALAISTFSSKMTQLLQNINIADKRLSSGIGY
jgi:hypothetical protein